MNATDKYYKKWIGDIAKYYRGKKNATTIVKRHIIHHAKQLNDPKTNAPLSWAASMQNLLAVYGQIHCVKVTTPVLVYKLLKKYNKNPMRYTPPPGGAIPKTIMIKKVRANSH